MEDELRDRFGPLSWQVQNLLYVLRLKMKAQQAGVQSIVREQDRIVLRFRHDIGGARRALQRVLPRGVEVGNNQIRLSLDDSPEDWEAKLVDVVDKLTDFTRRVLESAAAV